MKYLHVAIIEDFEECLVSFTEDGLRKQVTDSLIEKSITPPTDDEWAVCILAKSEHHIKTDNLALGLISYYKIRSALNGENFSTGNGMESTVNGQMSMAGDGNEE